MLSQIKQALKLLQCLGIQQRFIGKDQYVTGSGCNRSGGQDFVYQQSVVLQLRQNPSPFKIYAYLGIGFQELKLIIERGLHHNYKSGPYQTLPDGLIIFTNQKEAICKQEKNFYFLQERRVSLVLGLRLSHSEDFLKIGGSGLLVKDLGKVRLATINLTYID